jgi:outer membrane receptor protein involved in Fe transport
VTAQRHEMNVFDVPQSMTVMDQREIARKIPRSTPEALMESAGVWMQKTNHGGGSPFIRGLVGNQVLVLVDGIRLNNTTFRYGPNQYLNTIDPSQIERIEILRGSGSVLYGSDALGGVINIVTKQPNFSNDGIHFISNLYLKYMSSNMEKSGRIELGFSSSRMAVLGGFSMKDFGDLKAGGDLGTESPSGYSEINGDLKAVVRLSSKQLLTMSYQNVNQYDIPRFDQVTQRGYLKYSFDPQTRQMAYLKFESFLSSKWVDSFGITTSWQQSTEGRIKEKRGERIRTTEEDDVDVYGLSFKLHSKPLKIWTMSYGVDYYYDKVHSWRRDLDLESNTVVEKRGLYPDGATAKSLAVFINNLIVFKKLSINFGGRFNHYSLSAVDETFNNLRISPEAWVSSASFMYSIHQDHKLTTSVSQGFRAPNINDMSSLGGFDYGIEVPGVNLSPEKTMNFEFVYKSRMNHAALSLAVYRTNLFDLIDRVQSTFNGSAYYENQRVYQKQNIDKAYIQGLEAEFELVISPQLVVFNHIIYTIGQKLSTEEPMRRIPPLNGQVGLRWSDEKGVWGEARLLFAGKQDRLSQGDIDDHRIPEGGTPGWITVNIRGGYSFGSSLDLTMGLQNLFNKAYRMHGSGVDAYGRSFWIGMGFHF